MLRSALHAQDDPPSAPRSLSSALPPHTTAGAAGGGSWMVKMRSKSGAMMCVALLLSVVLFVFLFRDAARYIERERRLVERLEVHIVKTAEAAASALNKSNASSSSSSSSSSANINVNPGTPSQSSQKKLQETVICNGTTVASISDCSIMPDRTQVNNIIQAGFSIEQAESALRAVGNEQCCSKQISWLHERSSERNRELYSSLHNEHQHQHDGGNASSKDIFDVLTRRCPVQSFPSCCHMSEHTDYDGIAVIWGGQNIQPTPEDCCQSCRDYVPKPPHFYPCNIWVYCPYKQHQDATNGTGTCFAPAAGVFTVGQCWLKYQENPIIPRVNMRGKYSDEYLRRHPEAPSHVEWTAGLIIEEADWGHITNGTWSPRANW